jgi:hypothetical protein
MRALKYILLIVLVGLAILTLEPAGSAQCAMCRASLAGSNNAHFIRNLNIGILVLLVPPVAMFCSIFIVLKRHRKQEDDPAAQAPLSDSTNGRTD